MERENRLFFSKIWVSHGWNHTELQTYSCTWCCATCWTLIDVPEKPAVARI